MIVNHQVLLEMRKPELRFDAYTCYVACTVWVVCFTAWLFFGRSLFEVGYAFAIFGALGYFAKSEKTTFSRFLYFVACNNLFDETFGDPYAIRWTEYAIAAAFLMYYVFIDKHIPTIKHTTRRWLKKLTRH
jgi:hypothetical protein